MITTPDLKEYKLSHGNTIALFIIYTLFLLGGLGLSVLILLHEYTIFCEYPVLLKAIIGSFGITLVGSSIFYSRKLYKHSIKPTLSSPSSDAERIQRTGIFMYFLLRPFFALCFSFLIILGFKVSILIISVKDETLNNGFIYLTMFTSFFAGYSAGDILAILEEMGKRKMKKYFDGHES